MDSLENTVKTAVIRDRVVAYFSMEIALESAMPTYAGGLGILAGDTIRAAADLKVPMVAVSLLDRKGYFRQTLEADGTQLDEPAVWSVGQFLEELPARATATVEGRAVHLRAWRYVVTGHRGAAIPVYFLDAALPENAKQDRTLTDHLYGGDGRYRLAQEVLLGIGGVRMLRALGYQNIFRFHMNEGHASLLTLALLDEQAEITGRWLVGPEELQRVREQCVFTTHTPVPSGHDQFSLDLVDQIIGRPEIAALPEIFCSQDRLNLTWVGLHLSCYVNGVARVHGAVSRKMFESVEIDTITNGIHAATWAAPSFQALFDRAIPNWRDDTFSLRHAMSVPPQEIWDAHQAAKRRLFERVQRQASITLDPEMLTFGFARRVAPYKRATLLFHDLERLKQIAEKAGRFQVLYAGKAHPNDPFGKDLIKQVFQAKATLKPAIQVVYLENYDLELGKLLTAGADVWLNNPVRPFEASGTSGMKAALNGVPSLSVLDGWWVEGHIEGVTGWAIGNSLDATRSEQEQTEHDAVSLYEKLEQVVIPMFYHHRGHFIHVMRQAIAFNGSYFNTQRMVQEYVLRAYFC